MCAAPCLFHVALVTSQILNISAPLVVLDSPPAATEGQEADLSAIQLCLLDTPGPNEAGEEGLKYQVGSGLIFDAILSILDAILNEIHLQTTAGHINGCATATSTVQLVTIPAIAFFPGKEHSLQLCSTTWFGLAAVAAWVFYVWWLLLLLFVCVQVECLLGRFDPAILFLVITACPRVVIC
jgi:hypothetical protein